MDKFKLRKILKDKPRQKLIEFIEKISKKYSFNFRFDTSKERGNKLVSLAWQALLRIQSRESKENFENLIQSLMEDSQKAKTEQTIPKDIVKREKIRKTQALPFHAEEICELFHKLLVEDQEFMTIWKLERKKNGFFSLLGRNNLNIPEVLKKMLYLRIFKQNNEIFFDNAKLINYGRYHLDLWEKDLKFILDSINQEETDMILSIHLIYDWIVRILEKKKIIIYYKTDDIPLFKRVILAQYLKLLDINNYSDETLDKMATAIIDIINDKIKGSSIEILPWGDLD